MQHFAKRKLSLIILATLLAVMLLSALFSQQGHLEIYGREIRKQVDWRA